MGVKSPRGSALGLTARPARSEMYRCCRESQTAQRYFAAHECCQASDISGTARVSFCQSYGFVFPFFRRTGLRSIRPALGCLLSVAVEMGLELGKRSACKTGQIEMFQPRWPPINPGWSPQLRERQSE